MNKNNMSKNARVRSTKINLCFAIAALSLSMLFLTIPAMAASMPSLSLTNNGSMVQISVTGADQYASVMFNYPNGSTNSSISLGQTDSNGSFSASVAPNSYGLVTGSPVYVSVDGASTASVAWPSSSGSPSQTTSNLYLSQQNITLTVTQSANISVINAVGTLSIPGNTNPSVVNASLQGSTVQISAVSIGASTITVCASSSGCSNLNVVVQSSSSSGQVVSFSQVQANVNVGQQQTINIYGPGTYYGLTNSNQNAVSAGVNGNSLVLTGIATGQSIVSLCATGWQCGSLTVTSVVPSAAVSAPIASTVSVPSSQAPQLSTMSISSSDVNNSFFGAGSVLSITFSTNQPISNVQVRIGGSQGSLSGSGSGLYSTQYTLTGNETLPIPVIIMFASQSGIPGQAYFWIGNSVATPSAPSSMSATNPIIASPASPSSSSGAYSFDNYLYMGMNPIGTTNPDVAALQKRLAADGIYSGPITGYFGSQTKAALEKYQIKHGLSPIGVVGPSTRNLLNEGI